MNIDLQQAPLLESLHKSMSDLGTRQGDPFLWKIRGREGLVQQDCSIKGRFIRPAFLLSKRIKIIRFDPWAPVKTTALLLLVK